MHCEYETRAPWIYVGSDLLRFIQRFCTCDEPVNSGQATERIGSPKRPGGCSSAADLDFRKVLERAAPSGCTLIPHDEFQLDSCHVDYVA